MAKDKTAGGALRVSKCSCETGRDRYRVSKNTPIPFEQLVPFLFHGEADLADDGDGEGEHSSNDEDDEFAGLLAIANHEQGELGQPNDMEEESEADGVVPPNGQALNATAAIDDFAQADWTSSDSEDADFDLESESVASDSGSGDPSDGYHKIPRIARWRLNLTALSQRYNLYCVAYRERIHISRPRSCITHALPSTPDLVLKPEASIMGRMVGGTIDQQVPHQVNHLIIADFGEEEILLLAYDDGDVIAYYIRHIEDEITRQELHQSTPAQDVQPFFHENVGISAWGLAVHKSSRLIAVGSNTRDATVFIPALSGSCYNSLISHASGSPALYKRFAKDENGARVYAANQIDVIPDHIFEDSVRRRDTNWMVVLHTGPLGDNIPNLTFGSDTEGNADKIVAIDVTGNIWLMDIWNVCVPHQRIPGLHRAKRPAFPGDLGKPRGWGVLVLHEDAFLSMDGYKNTLGMPEHESRIANHPSIGQWIDVSRAVSNIPGNSLQHPWARARHTEQSALVEHRRMIENEYWYAGYTDRTRGRRWPAAPSPPADHSRSRLGGQPTKEDYADARTDTTLVLKDGSSILRTYETDIELRSPDKRGVGIMFQHATRQVQLPPRGLPAMRWAHERLSNNLYVPELSIVVLGSMGGRVALATLTRPRSPTLGFARGFKIEAILPTRKDEDDRARPICPLYGVAVGPLPLASRPQRAGLPRQASARRYRIMLQYYDLRILSYEISRNSGTHDIMIT